MEGCAVTFKLTVVLFGFGIFAAAVNASAADANKGPVEATATQSVDLAPGGTVSLDDSFGYVTVEGWDRPQVELTVTKSREGLYTPKERERITQQFGRVQVVAETQSVKELKISTVLSSRHGLRRFFPPPARGSNRAGVNLEYRIHVPRDSRLIIHHHGGSIFVSGVDGDIHATSSSGDIVLTLANAAGAAIDAKTLIGNVSLDFADPSHRFYLAGERFRTKVHQSQRVYVRLRVGTITVEEAGELGRAR